MGLLFSKDMEEVITGGVCNEMPQTYYWGAEAVFSGGKLVEYAL